MPRIKTTRTARVALWALRIYLLILLSLIGLKFASVFSHSRTALTPAAATGPAPAGAPIPGQ